MAARIPILHKTPFALDPRPLADASSPHAGLLATSRAYRALGIPDLIATQLKLRQGQSGYSAGQMSESLVLLQTVGGECPEDIRLLANDSCLERGLGYRLPKGAAVREFLELFHDAEEARPRPAREASRRAMPPGTAPLAALQEVQAYAVWRMARWYEAHGQTRPIATIDLDAAIIASPAGATLSHAQEGNGHGGPPLLAAWAEADLVLADVFRDGHRPAPPESLTCAQLAFAALPTTIIARYFRGDAACDEPGLLEWLTHTDRIMETGGAIGFAISARANAGLHQALQKLPDEAWTTFGTEPDGTLRQWARVPYVPEEYFAHADRRPLRYVGLRLLKPHGVRFADGLNRQHHVVLTNRNLPADKLLDWHREHADRVAQVRDAISALGGGPRPSPRGAVNAAWFKFAGLSYNLASAIKGLCFAPEERTASFQQYRLRLVHVAGRMNRRNCVMSLRLCAPQGAHRRMQKVWEVFPLKTHATAAKEPWDNPRHSRRPASLGRSYFEGGGPNTMRNPRSS